MNLVIDLIYIRSTHHLNDKLKPERESPAHNNMTERHENIIPNVPLCHSRENGNPEIAARAIRGGGACPRAFTECGAVVAGGHKGLPYEYGKFADYSPNIAIGGCVSAVGVAVAMVGGRKSAVTNREVAVVNRISALFSHIAALLSSMVLVENAIAALFCHNSALLYSISALQNHFAVGNTISDCGFAYSDCENELEGFNVEE